MDFTLEVKKHPSAVHKVIYSHARGIVPLEKSISTLNDPDMCLSATEFHGFMLEMLSDMYDYPEAYSLPVMELESFCKEKKVNGMKQIHPSKTKKLLSQTRNVVESYMELLFYLGKYGTIKENHLYLTHEHIEDIARRTSTSKSPIHLEKRLEALKRNGLCREENSFISQKYATMFSSMRKLAKESNRTSGFDYFAFTTVNFRNIETKYRPTYEDYFHPLFFTQRKQAYDLHNYVMAKKLKPNISTFFKVDYKYKGTQVMCIGSEWENERILDIRIVGTYHWEDSALINNRLVKESPEFQRDVLRHIWRCDACSTTHLGQFVVVLGKKQRVCGGGMIGFRFQNPDNDDMETIKKLIQMRCDIIDEVKH